MEGLDNFLENAFAALENKEKKRRRRLSSISIDRNLQSKKKIHGIISNHDSETINDNKNNSTNTINLNEVKVNCNFNNVITQDDLYSSLTLKNNDKKDKVVGSGSSIKKTLVQYFPSEQVFQSEVHENKNFLLDKYIAQKAEDKKHKLKKKRVCDKFSEIKKNLDKSNINFIKFREINKLWLNYIYELFTFEPSKVGNILNFNESFIEKNYEGLLIKFLKCDLTGSYIEIIESLNRNLLSLKGIVVYESKNSFIIVNDKNELKTVLKKGSIFKFPLYLVELDVYENGVSKINTENTCKADTLHLKGNNKYCFKILGDNFLYKSTERTKVKFKK